MEVGIIGQNFGKQTKRQKISMLKLGIKAGLESLNEMLVNHSMSVCRDSSLL